MREKIKQALRLKSDAFNAEIDDIIAAGKADLSFVGINIFYGSEVEGEGEGKEVSDPLIIRALILYAKANYGYSEDAEKFMKAYDGLKSALSLGGDYALE